MKLPPLCAAMAISLALGLTVNLQKVLAQTGNHQGNELQAQPARTNAGFGSQPGVAATPAAGGQTRAAVPSGNGSVLTPSAVPVTGGQQLATSRAQASEQARLGAGRSNPFSGIEGGYPPFPSHGAAIEAPTTSPGPVPNNAAKTLARKRAEIGPLVPPPPPSAIGPSSLGGHEMIMPPPQGSLDPKELPAPPDKPSIASKLKLVGIIGDRALFVFTDPLMRDQHKWPHNISLGVGEMFENVSVVNVTPDSVTIEEDGDRSVRELPRIR